MFTLCNHCGGRGHILGSTHDREGRRLYAEPPRETCSYCNGLGCCEEGDKLLPAVPPKVERPGAGLPAWA